MNNRIKDKISYILYLALGITLLFLVIENIENPWILVFLSALLISSFTARNSIFQHHEPYGFILKYLLLGEFIFLLIISILDQGSSSLVYYYLLAADIIINYSFKTALSLNVSLFFMYVVKLHVTMGYPGPIEIIPRATFSSVGFIVLFLVMYVVKYVLKQNEFIGQTLRKLTVKTLEQENTYKELMKAYAKLEEMTILKERTKIAREIHDTVGHTLTTVLVEMEAGKALCKKDIQLGLEKFELAQQQMRKGMSDLRNSVRMLSEGNEIVDFDASILSLIRDTQKHTGVVIKYEIGPLPELSSSLKKTLYRALQEGLTNSIKHGKSTALFFRLKTEDNNIFFLLKDNGAGCSSIIPGFGLRAMDERIKEHHGSLHYHSEPTEGFTLAITIPIDTKEDKHGKN